MDIVEINKMCQSKKVRSATDNLYSLSKITKNDSLILMIYACKKMYGIGLTTKIIHGLGVRDL